MFDHQEEVDYCTDRIDRSTKLALASIDSCARASHAGIAEAYGKRLAALTAEQAPPPAA